MSVRWKLDMTVQIVDRALRYKTGTRDEIQRIEQKMRCGAVMILDSAQLVRWCFGIENTQDV